MIKIDSIRSRREVIKERSSYFAYKRAKATDIRIPHIAKNKSIRGLLFTYKAIIDTTNVNSCNLIQGKERD